jgi:hypothetical protein
VAIVHPPLPLGPPTHPRALRSRRNPPQGETPLDMAKVFGKAEVEAMLRKVGSDSESGKCGVLKDFLRGLASRSSECVHKNEIWSEYCSIKLVCV